MSMLRRTLIALLSAALMACANPAQPPQYSAKVERSAGGIPHITANDWGSLGYATGYVQAEDNVCILAQQYLKFGAQRTQYTPEDPRAWASDFFYQLLIDRGDADQEVPADLESLFAGYADGYNRYLTDTSIDKLTDASCRGAAWVKPTSTLAVKRISSVDYALDYMLGMIVNAKPPLSNEEPNEEPNNKSNKVPEDTPAKAMSDPQIAAAVDIFMEVPKQGGSNAIAIGGEGAQNATSLLLANPHMPWNEPFQRFYPMHHIIPGELNMLGANLLGRPRVGFGTTEKVAWTSTVSTAKRMSFYQLSLVKGNPTQYIFDGKNYDMLSETVTVNGRTHTFYSTHFGAMLVQSPFFQWNSHSAVAVLMHNVGFRGEVSTFEQYQAQSVADLKAVHNKYQFLSVNLIAADANGDVMYTDPGPVPYLTDKQLTDCGVMHGAALDGSRSACQWHSDTNAAAKGILPPDQLPLIYRRDYVTNSNDSYWLANPNQPLAGYASILGSERSNRTLRTRSGLTMVQRYLAGEGGDGELGITLDELLEITLLNENFAGQLIRDDLVGFCREQSSVEVEGEMVDLSKACKVLADWDLHANLDSRGAHLFRQMLAGANNKEFRRYLPPAFTPAMTFDAYQPLQTPSGLNTSARETVLLALANAVLELQAANLPLDATLGELQGVTRNGEFISIHGGPEYEGIFNKIEAAFEGEQAYPDVTSWSSSWIMATEFSHRGPRSRGILTHSLSANPDSPWYMDQTKMYAAKQWLELPFSPEDVSSAAIETYTLESN